MKALQSALGLPSQKTAFTPTAPAGLPPVESALAPALLDDAARMFHELGLKAVRAAVVDLASMEFHHVWGMSDNGIAGAASGVLATELPLDSQFPGARKNLQQLVETVSEFTVEQRLSPRHWSFAWRLDGERAMVAEARYHDARAIVGMIDTALVRLLCDTGIHAGLSGGDDTEDDSPLIWPASRERRLRRKGLRQSRLSAVALAAGSALLAVWMVFVALPDVSRQSAKQQMVVEKTMAQTLSVAMATGDYGEVQHALTTAQSIGFFSGAAVTNAGQRVVSLASAGAGWRIGDVVPASAGAEARKVELTLGSQRYGTLWLIGSSMGDPGGALAALRIAAMAVLAAAAASALLLLRRRRARRSGD